MESKADDGTWVMGASGTLFQAAEKPNQDGSILPVMVSTLSYPAKPVKVSPEKETWNAWLSCSLEARSCPPPCSTSCHKFLGVEVSVCS